MHNLKALFPHLNRICCFFPRVNVPCARMKNPCESSGGIFPERRRRRRSLRLSPPQRCNFHFSKSGGARGGGGEMGRKKVISAAFPQRLFLFPTSYFRVSSFPIMCKKRLYTMCTINAVLTIRNIFQVSL